MSRAAVEIYSPMWSDGGKYYGFQPRRVACPNILTKFTHALRCGTIKTIQHDLQH